MQLSVDTPECAECMLNGLDFTKLVTCDELENGIYCQGVAECVNLKCKKDCREKYYDGLNCAIQQSCSNITCSPPKMVAAESILAEDDGDTYLRNIK
mmetsp:Transcript_22294/g.48380  ORF Transcript_22294/g.48380 Transcript_22294/m.48380 type:complete len:97 (-) Transcript_22294:273-563(-)